MKNPTEERAHNYLAKHVLFGYKGRKDPHMEKGEKESKARKAIATAAVIEVFETILSIAAGILVSFSVGQLLQGVNLYPLLGEPLGIWTVIVLSSFLLLKGSNAFRHYKMLSENERLKKKERDELTQQSLQDQVIREHLQRAQREMSPVEFSEFMKKTLGATNYRNTVLRYLKSKALPLDK